MRIDRGITIAHSLTEHYARKLKGNRPYLHLVRVDTMGKRFDVVCEADYYLYYKEKVVRANED